MIAFKIKQDFFDDVYIKADDEQKTYKLVGIKLGPGHVCFHVSDGSGEVIELYQEEMDFERNEALRLNFDNKDE